MVPPYPASKGTQQSGRQQLKLISKAPSIDEISVQDFLNFVNGFSELISFWNLNNLPEGDWKRFFSQDLSFLLAEILKTDLRSYPRLANTVTRDFSLTHQLGKRERCIVRLLELNLEIGQLVMGWYSSIKEQVTLHPVNEPIARLIEEELTSKIWKPSLTMKEYFFSMVLGFAQNPNRLAGRNLGPKVNKLCYMLEELWKPDLLKKEETEVIQQTYASDNLDDLLGYFMEAYEGFYGAAHLLQQHTPKYITSSLRESNHSPQVSLLLALFRMMEPLKQELNGFLPQHLDFYYRDVLLLTPKREEPHQIPIHFELTGSDTEVVHSKGTTLAANYAQRNRINQDAKTLGSPSYLIEKSVSVTQARIKAFKTIFNGTLFDPTSLLIASPIANSGSGRGGKILKNPPSWPTFGRETLSSEEGAILSDTTQLGWAIASPGLHLLEGKRTVQICWNCRKETLENIQQSFSPKLSSAQLCTYLEACFQLSFTSEKGWGLIESYTVSLSKESLKLPDPDSPKSTPEPFVSHGAIPADLTQSSSPKPGIVFTFVLSKDEPSCSSYNNKIHGPGFDTLWPVIKGQLIQNPLNLKSEGTRDSVIYPNPYPLLAPQSFSSPALEVMVEGVETFSVQNDFSLLSTKKPFPLLGVNPIVGSNFYLGNSEIFAPGLAGLNLTLTWYDLPGQPNGFSDYYSVYNRFYGKEGLVPPFTNAAFQWGACLLSDKGVWKAIEPEKMNLSNLEGSAESDRLTSESNEGKNEGKIANNDCSTLAFPMFEWSLPDPPVDPPPPDLQNQIEQVNAALTNIQDDLTSVGRLISKILDSLKPTWLKKNRKDVSIKKSDPETSQLDGDSRVQKQPLPSYYGTLKPSSQLRFSDINGKIKTDSPEKGNGKYTPEATSGFLRLSLLNPVDGFGQELYMKTLAKVANNNISVIASGGGATDDSFTNPKSGSDGQIEQDAAKTPIPGGGWIGPVLNVIKALINSILQSVKILKKRIELWEKVVKMETELMLPPNPPYIPKVKKVSADYIANPVQEGIEVFQIHPFGIEKCDETSQFALVPDYQQAGYLYIGLSGISLPAKISLLFFLNEGSGNRNVERPTIQWSVLQGSKWTELASMAVQDDTFGFARSGIIDLSLPIPADQNSTWPISFYPVEEQLYWIRATVAQHPGAISEIIDVFPHATLVKASIQDDTKSTSSIPTLSGSVQSGTGKDTGSSVVVPDILPPNASKTLVKQPLPPREGKSAESVPQFYTRVSERLRHKNRALVSWDFEHIVLEEFPKIGYVKCLNHTSIKKRSIVMPGHASLLILPSWSQKGISLFAPKTSSMLVEQIASFLSGLIPPSLSLEVQNPEYEIIEVEAEIYFSPEIDSGKALKAINEQLISHIAPWITDPHVKPFDNTVSYFSLLSSVETFPGVEKVLKFDVYKKESIKDQDSKKHQLPVTFDPVKATNPWSLLTSSSQHSLISSLILQNEEPLLEVPSVIIQPAPSQEESIEKPMLPLDSLRSKDAGMREPEVLFIRNDLYHE